MIGDYRIYAILFFVVTVGVPVLYAAWEIGSDVARRRRARRARVRTQRPTRRTKTRVSRAKIARGTYIIDDPDYRVRRDSTGDWDWP